MRNRSQKGFTLIELLIVIAIIGILAAVLIPNLLAARQRAFDAAAQACANEVLVAAEVYNIDNPRTGYVGFTAPDTGACTGLTVTLDNPDPPTATLIGGTVTSLSGATVNFSNTVPISVDRP